MDIYILIKTKEANPQEFGYPSFWIMRKAKYSCPGYPAIFSLEVWVPERKRWCQMAVLKANQF